MSKCKKTDRLPPLSRYDREKRKLDMWNKTGVFRETINGITVGFFVGWRNRWGAGARNIRAGQYFETADAAIAWRDDMEARRKPMHSEFEQIA